MLLKYIDLDLPYNENKVFIKELIKKDNIEEADAIVIDYQENWKWKRMNFRDEVRCIAEMYIYNLGKFETKETKKVIIHCVTEISTHEVKTCDGFTEIEVELDFHTYSQLSNEDKKKLILEKLYEGVTKVAQYYQWNLDLFKDAYHSIVEKHYKNEYVWKKKSSPSRKYTAEIFCQHEIDKYVIKMNIKTSDTDELIKSEILITERPNEFAFVKHLGNLKWESNTKVVLLNKSRTNQWLVCID